MLFGPIAEEVTVEVARRIGVDMLCSSTTDLVAEVLAGVRVDLVADEALPRAGHWAPDLIIVEHCDLLVLVASALAVPCAGAVAGPGLEPGELDALAATVRSRYRHRWRGQAPPAPASTDCRPSNAPTNSPGTTSVMSARRG